MYKAAEALNPLAEFAAPVTAAAAIAKEAGSDWIERTGRAEGRRNIHGEMGTKGSRWQYEAGRRQLNAVGGFVRVNQGLFVIGVGAAAFQGAAIGYCANECP